MKELTIKDVSWQGKKALVRVDYNVPMDDEGNIRETLRIEASLPTLRYILDDGGAIILLTHLGRPKGEHNLKYTTRTLADALARLLSRDVQFGDDLLSAETAERCKNLKSGEVLMLENVRFYPEEEANDEAFAKHLASLGDYFVNDAFSVNHRAHASTVGITKFMQAYAGCQLKREIECLDKVVYDPDRPLVAIIGGAKISDKIKILSNLLPIVEKLLIGGGMANTFLAAQGYDMQKSLVEHDNLVLAKELLDGEHGRKIVLPVDLVAAAAFDAEAQHQTVPVDSIPVGYQALDIGPETVELFEIFILKAKTVMWNGPMGVFELEPFAAGTKAVARILGGASAFSVVGGGDSSAALKAVGMEDGIDHISTGGGASLKYLEGNNLPGIAALETR